MMSPDGPTSISRKPPACFRPISRSWVPSACRPVTLKYITLIGYCSTVNVQQDQKNVTCSHLLSLVVTNRSKQAWPISKLGLYAQRFDDDRRFYQPCTLWQRSKNHHPLVQVIQLSALGFLITGYSFLVLGCFLFLEVYMNQMKRLLQFHNSHAANYL